MAEQPVDFGAGGVGILDRVVQERRRDGGVVELQLGEDRGHLQGMRDIGVAGVPLLLAVRLHGVDVGAVEQVLIGLGIILFDPFDQLVLPHELRLARLRRRRLSARRHQLRAARRRPP